MDASAVLALLNNETGADLVQELLPEAVISAINLAEIITRLTLLGMPESEIRKALDILGLVIIPFDDNQAYLAGSLSLVTKPLGLSLGDRACLALALQTGYSAVTSDKAWQALEIGVDIRIIR
jgi:PIN domain nuclease of toxin-antitoxin system